jgi:hypothetical protein
MKKLILVIFIITAVLHSAEIIPIWHTESGAGDIQDMELLPGGNELMLTTASGEIQIRDVLSGDTLRTYRDNSNLFMNGYFEFTPDSTRFVMANSGLLQLVQLDNFERIKYFAFGSDTIAKGFKSLVLDPIKPFAYTIITGWEKSSGNNEMRSKVSVYNYETMELVKDLTDYQGYEFSSIAVSDDGKYLATLNNGKAYLKVWDLATMELIRDVQLYDDKLPNNEWWCDSKDIQFSKLNSDVVYYSGNFPNKEKGIQVGLFKYNIISSNSTDDITKSGYSGKIIIFDNDYRSLVYSSRFLYFNNFTNNTFDRYYKPTGIYPGTKTNYNKKNNCFLGVEGSIICKFQYDIASNTKSNYEEEIKVIPNPTNNFVNIELNCIEPLINYQINDINGLIIFQSSTQNQVGNIRIDFTSYPPGVYFITINCGNDVKTYKVVREG